METTTIRLNNLRRLVAGYESQQAFAEVAGLSVQYLNQLLGGHRNIGRKQPARSKWRCGSRWAGWIGVPNGARIESGRTIGGLD